MINTSLIALEQGNNISSSTIINLLRQSHANLTAHVAQIEAGFHLVIGVTDGLLEAAEGPFFTEEEAQAKRDAMAEDYGTPGQDDVYRIHVQFLPKFTQHYHDGPIEPIDEPDDDPYDEVLIHTMVTEGGPG